MASSPQGTDRVIEIVTQCFNTLNVYGKTADQLPSIIKIFLLVLGNYSADEVIYGFHQYIERNSNFPTPADIVNIIDPEPEMLSAAVYVAIKKRAVQGEYIYGREREYVRQFEAQEHKRMRGGSAELREAQREIEMFTHRLKYHEIH